MTAPQGMPQSWSRDNLSHNGTVLSRHCLQKRLVLLRDRPLVRHHITITTVDR